MSKLIDLSNKKFGKLFVIKMVEPYISPNGNIHPKWLCKCSCGKTIITRGDSLRNGVVKSCGCLKGNFMKKRKRTISGIYKEEFFKKNIASKRIYNIYNSILNKCYNKYNYSYRWYGNVGVSVCSEWKDDFSCFYEWCIKNGYDISKNRKEQTLDRINPYGNYCPENCRFITIQEQQKNKRNNIKIEYNGKIKNLREWCNILGKNYNTVYCRIFKQGKDFINAIK